MCLFQSLAASGDSAAAYNTLGPGLERRDDGLLEVTDPTQAYLQVAADGSSDYVRVVPVSDEVLQGLSGRVSACCVRCVCVLMLIVGRVSLLRCRWIRLVHCM